MMPTLSHSGDLLIESCLSRRLWPTSFQRGDLVTVISPLDPHRLVCKRILGLEGDTVCVDPTGDVVPSNEHIVVPKGHIWIIGDNATASRDSRTYGPVPMALVQGKVLARVCCTIAQNSVTHLPKGVAHIQVYHLPKSRHSYSITPRYREKLTEYPPCPFGSNLKLSVDKPNFPGNPG